MKVTERPVDLRKVTELEAEAAEALDSISGVIGGSSIEAIDHAVHAWSTSGTTPVPALETSQLIAVFGMAWGGEFVRRHSWHWADLVFHDFGGWKGRAVVSPDRSLFLLPFAHIHECLGGNDEVKISACLAAIGSNVIPALAPDSFENVAHGIQRILPRG